MYSEKFLNTNYAQKLIEKRKAKGYSDKDAKGYALINMRGAFKAMGHKKAADQADKALKEIYHS